MVELHVFTDANEDAYGLLSRHDNGKGARYVDDGQGENRTFQISIDTPSGVNEGRLFVERGIQISAE